MKALRNLIAASFVLGAVACARGAPDVEVDPDAPTTVVVDNQGFSDMTIYVFEGSRRIRLGIAGGHSETRFTLPKYLVRHLTSLRFQGDPIGGSRTPYSDEIQVSPGDQLLLRIPPS